MRRSLAIALVCTTATAAQAQVIPFNQIRVRPTSAPAQPPKSSPGRPGIQATIGGAGVDSPTVIRTGMGYDALTGEIIPNVCVDPGANGVETFGEGETTAAYDHEFISTVTDMAESDSASGSSAGFDFTYKVITVGFQTGSDSSSLYNSVDSYGRVYKSLVVRGEALDNGRWSALGGVAAAKPIRTFTDRCGTHYIRGIYYGHVLDQTIRFKLANTKYTSSDKNSFSLGVSKLFGFNYNDTSSQTDVNSRGSLSVIDESRGLINTIPVTDGSGVQTLVKYARETFPGKVQSADLKTAAIVFVEIVPYYRLAASGASSMPRWPEQVRGAIMAKASLYKQFLSAMSDIDFALALPTDDVALKELYGDDRAKLIAKQTDALGIQKAMRTAAIACHKLLEAGVDDAAGRTKCEADLDAALTPAMVARVRPLTK